MASRDGPTLKSQWIVERLLVNEVHVPCTPKHSLRDVMFVNMYSRQGMSTTVASAAAGEASVRVRKTDSVPESVRDIGPIVLSRLPRPVIELVTPRLGRRRMVGRMVYSPQFAA